MELIIASGNKHKIIEIKKILSDLNLSISACDPEIIEDGKNYRENAEKKARYLADTYHKIILADDSGLEIEALNGEPGIFSARYLDEKLTYQERNVKVLELLKDVPREKRKALFRCVMSLALTKDNILSCEGICHGEIGFTPKGDKGFGYDPIFFISQMEKTMAELNEEEKNKISHRGLALEKIKKILEKQIGA